MIEGRERDRLALESRQAIGIGGNRIGQDLERDIAVQFGIAGAIHLAHSAGADATTISNGPDASLGTGASLGILVGFASGAQRDHRIDACRPQRRGKTGKDDDGRLQCGNDDIHRKVPGIEVSEEERSEPGGRARRG